MTARLDLLLVNPNTKKAVYQELSTRLVAIEPPVWAGLMATFVRGKGRSVAILDAEAEGLSPAEVGDRVAAMAPRLVAIPAYGHQPSASTQVMPGVRQAASAVREVRPDLPILLLGGHVAALPERTLEDEPCDFVAGGEGLHTLTDLLECLESAPGQLANVRGLVWRQSGKVVVNPPAPLVQDLDGEMPGVAWDLLPMDRYRAHNWHCFGERGDASPTPPSTPPSAAPTTAASAASRRRSRAASRRWASGADVNTYRYWSPERSSRRSTCSSGSTACATSRSPTRCSSSTRRHVLGICDRIVERGYDLNIWAYARVDTVRDGLLEKMRRAGVNWLALGIEAANERVRDDVERAIGQDGHRADRPTGSGTRASTSSATTSSACPRTTCETMQADARPGDRPELRVRQLLLGDGLSRLAALPRSGGRAAGRCPTPGPATRSTPCDTLPLCPRGTCRRREVLRFRDEAFQRYFRNPRYLEMVRRLFGGATVAEVTDMLEVRLERHHA